MSSNGPQQYSQQPQQYSQQPQQYSQQPQQYNSQQTQQNPQQYNQPIPPPRPSFQVEQKQSKQNGSNNTLDNGASSGFPSDASSRFVGLRKYKDLWAAVLFVIFLLGFVACAVVGISAFKENTSSSGSVKVPFLPLDYVFVFAGSIIFGFALSLAYFFAMKRYTRKLIIGSFIFQIALNVSLGLFLIFYAGNIISGAILLLVAALSAYLFYSLRSRIPFAQIILETVLSVMQKYPATITAGVIGLFVQTAFTAAWVIAMVGVALKIAAQNQSSSGSVSSGYYVLISFLLLTFYWTTQVVKNVVHVTVSGVFATYYFFGITDGQGRVTVAVANPTAASAKRALTTSFGTICFGSLLIAIIQMIKALAQQAANQNSRDGNMASAFCLICVTCLLGCLEGIMEYFNHYAFTQVAIYGKDFCDAAKSTWRLMKSKGIDAIINDSIIGNVLGLGTFIVGLLGAAFGAAVVSISTSIPKTTNNYLIICLVCFGVCAAEFAILIEVINSGVATTFVCLAEDPRALQRTKPELFNQIRQTYPQVGI